MGRLLAYALLQVVGAAVTAARAVPADTGRHKAPAHRAAPVNIQPVLRPALRTEAPALSAAA